jgi:large subunit ribosomal protein L18
MRATGRRNRREVRHRRARARLAGTPARPRLVVYRSLRHIYVQLVDDVAGKTIAAASSQSPELKGNLKHGGNKDAASKVGELIARRAGEKGIKQACFDRAGFKYHGCVSAVAEAARKAGLEF